VRAKLRAGDEQYNWLSSNHARAFYAKYKADPEHLEYGFLKSSLLVKVRDLNYLLCFPFHFFFGPPTQGIQEYLHIAILSGRWLRIRAGKQSSFEGCQALPIPKKGNATQRHIKTSHER
jgi:hypothetical protein